MAFSNAQFLAIISGVRSICDELLEMDLGAEIPPLDKVTVPLTTPPALKLVGDPNTPPALKLVGDPNTPPTGAAPGTAPGATPPVENPPPSSPPTGPPAVELDTEGLPWDERIHTAKKSKLKSGVWRIKPKTDPVVVAKVKTELALAAQAAPGTGAPPAGPGTGTPPADQGAGGGTEPPPVDAGTDTGTAAPMSWADLLNKIVNAGKNPEEVLAACTACNVENIGKLQDVPAMIPNVAVALGI